MPSSSDRMSQNLGVSQLMTPPPPPNKRRDRTKRHAMHGSPNQKRRKTDGVFSPAPATEGSLVHGRRSRARKSEGKRLRKAAKNRMKLAAKHGRKRDTIQSEKAAQSLAYQVPTTPPRTVVTQKKDVASRELSPATLLVDHLFSEPETNDENQESSKSGENEDEQMTHPNDFNDAMHGYDSIKSSDSEAYTLANLSTAKDMHYKKLDDTISAIEDQSFDAVSYPQPANPEDHAVITTALNLLLTLQAEQTTLNARSNAIEFHVSRLKSTKFKLDYIAIAKLEEEYALTVALSFDLFIAEWAFRDLLEVNRNCVGFDLAGALGGLAIDVGALIERFEGGRLEV